MAAPNHTQSRPKHNSIYYFLFALFFLLYVIVRLLIRQLKMASYTCCPI